MLGTKNMDLNRFTKLKQQADKAKADADRAAGALEQLQTQLKTEFSCKDVASAKKLLTRLEAEVVEEEEEYGRLLTEFEDGLATGKWKESAVDMLINQQKATVKLRSAY
jgi:hypothetical protein